VFFPDKGSNLGNVAKAVCSACSVIAQCRTWALSEPDLTHGIFGGLNAGERLLARREMEEPRPAWQCKRGHDKREDPPLRTSDGCRTCKRERQNAYDKRRKAS
jgi:WhiB family redox-sensing transcriptional regulator